MRSRLLDGQRRQAATRRLRVDRVLARVGLSSQFERRSGVATVFGYHSVGDPSDDLGDPRMITTRREFRAQLEFLATHRHVVSVPELVELVTRDEPLPRGTVALTIDDGYADTLEIAAVELDRLGLHASVYVSPWFLETGTNMPTDRLYWAFTRRRADRLPDGIVSPGLQVLDADNEIEAFHVLGGRLIDLHPDARDRLLDDIWEALAPPDQPLRMLAIERLSELGTHDAVTLGVHGNRHADIRAFPELVDSEFGAARDVIAARAGVRPDDVGYCYNRQAPSTAAEIRAMGFRSALGAGDAMVNTRGTDPFRLMRLDGPLDVSALRALSL